MKYSIVDENLSADFGFIFEGQLIKLNIYGSPIDVILFEKMLKSIGFEKEDKYDCFSEKMIKFIGFEKEDKHDC